MSADFLRIKAQQVSKNSTVDYEGKVVPTFIVDDNGPFAISYPNTQLSKNEDHPINVVRTIMKTVPIASTLSMLYPKYAVTYEPSNKFWVACNTFKMNYKDKDEVPKTHCMSLKEYLDHPTIKDLFDCEDLIEDVIFKNKKGIRLSEEDAIELNAKFDPTKEVVDKKRKRVFTLPSVSANISSESSESSEESETCIFVEVDEELSSCFCVFFLGIRTLSVST